MAKKRLYDEEGNVVKGAKLKKPFYQRWWFIALVVIIVIGMFTGGDEEADTVAEPDEVELVDEVEAEDTGEVEEEPVEETSEEPEEVAYTIGDSVDVGDVTYVVNGIDTATNIGGEWGENSKGTFLIIDLTVTNNGDEALSVDNSFFKLLNDNKEFEADSVAGIYANDDDSFFLASINPELTLTGKIVFDVSDTVIESTTKQLQVSTGFWSTETEVINLQ